MDRAPNRADHVPPIPRDQDALGYTNRVPGVPEMPLGDTESTFILSDTSTTAQILLLGNANLGFECVQELETQNRSGKLFLRSCFGFRVMYLVELKSNVTCRGPKKVCRPQNVCGGQEPG